MTHSSEAVIVGALRSPVGRYGGVLRDVRPDDLGASVIAALVRATQIDPAAIDDVIWGCANQAGEDNRNVGRMSVLLAGLPVSVPGTTVNRLCGSSLEAIVQASRAIWSGDAEVVIAGGVESMSRAPYSIPKNLSGAYGNVTAYDTALGWRFPNPRMKELFPLESMGETAENVASQYGITREEQDRFALESHRRACRAQESGAFSHEVVPIEVPQKSGLPIRIERDEGPRPDTSMEQLAALKPAFRVGGSVTAGNSSSLNDGAAALVIMSAQRATASGLRPLVRVVSAGVAGVDPRTMGIGPVPATRIALRKAGLSVSDLGLVELNEAFAAQAIAVMRDLGLQPEKTNVNGGAIALGHPLGCSGARIMTTLIHAMKLGGVRYGLATMCIGVGQGISVVVEAIG
ncbi:MAG: thiolase family protein [Bacteroidota bacterium]